MLKAYADGARVKLLRALYTDTDSMKQLVGRTGVVRLTDGHGMIHVEIDPVAGEFGVHMLECEPINLDLVNDDVRGCTVADDPVYVASQKQLDQLASAGEYILAQQAEVEALKLSERDQLLRAWWAKV